MVVNSCSVIRCNLGFLSTSTEDFTYRAGPVPVLEGQSRILGGYRSLDSKTPECFRTDWRTSAYECQSSQSLHRTSTTKEGGTAPRVSVLSEPVQTDWVTFGLLGCYGGGGGKGKLEWLARFFYWNGFRLSSIFACVALFFVAPESRILLPRVATVRLFYDKGVCLKSPWSNVGGEKKREPWL